MSTDMRNFDLEALKQQVANGANWFYWVAGLSLVNMLVMMGDGNMHFIVGSSVVELFSALGKTGSTTGYVGAVLALGFFVFLGHMANRPVQWAFLLGMIIYGLDGLLYLAFQDFLPALFHAYVLYKLYQGMNAVKPYLQLQQDLADNPVMAVVPTITADEVMPEAVETAALPEAGQV